MRAEQVLGMLQGEGWKHVQKYLDNRLEEIRNALLTEEDYNRICRMQGEADGLKRLLGRVKDWCEGDKR